MPPCIKHDWLDREITFFEGRWLEEARRVCVHCGTFSEVIRAKKFTNAEADR